jgi:hypothetical protein
VTPASWRKPVIDFIDVIARKPQLGRRTIPINFGTDKDLCHSLSVPG